MLTKLSTFSGVSSSGEPLVRLFHQGDSVRKVASYYQPEVQDFLSSYKSDRKEIALLVNALGGSEHWGQNRNGDIWPWAALTHDCRSSKHQDHHFDSYAGKVIPDYGYWTFLKANPYVHHKNTDPSRTFGKVVVSCLNRPMKRVELVVLIDRELATKNDAQPFVDRLDADDYPDVSMGSRVPYDRCCICGHLSKTKEDYCAHVKELGMNYLLPDGRIVGVINDYPRFFDISFVFVGADKTAKVMIKLAGSNLWVPQSIRDAEEVYGLSSPKERLMVKTASMVSVPDDLISRVADIQEPPGKRLLDELEKTDTDSTKITDILDELFAAYLSDPRMEEAREQVSSGVGYSDGALRTNANESDAVPTDAAKLSAFREVAGLTSSEPLDNLGRSVARGGTAGAALGAVLLGRKTGLRGAAVGGLVGGLSGGATGGLGHAIHQSRRLAREQMAALENGSAYPTKTAEKNLQAPPVRDEFPFAGKYKFKGLEINVENRKGTWRVGKTWKTLMKHDYGEISESHGADGDPVDVYIGPNESANKVYIVHQNFARGPDKGKYDEDKIMLGFDSLAAAKDAYLAHYDSQDFLRSITEMDFDQFKKLIFHEDQKGEKIAGTNSAVGMSKVAAELEELFSGAATAQRRERTWRNKVTGCETNHKGSGLGTRFETMQKTASADVLEDIFKRAGQKSAEDKRADIVKEIEPDVTAGQIIEDLSDREDKLPKDTLNAMGSCGLEKALSTPSLMGMVLKPEEFQRILLSAIGQTDKADLLDANKQTFPVQSSLEAEAPCGCLGKEYFDPKMMQRLLPALEGRSYMGPIVERRVIRIMIVPKAEASKPVADDPLLSKVAAAYNWYRTEMLKVAAQAPEVIREQPELYARVLGSHFDDIFDKHASVPDRNSLGAMIAAVPLSLMYAASLRRDIERGKDVGLIQYLLASHPYLTALGASALVREIMKNQTINRVVGNTAAEAASAGQRIFGTA